MLTVLVEEKKLQQFRDYASNKEVSMGWVVNKLLDRVLSGELTVSEDSYSAGSLSIGISRDEVESMIKASLENTSTPSLDSSDIENLIKTYVASLDIESVVKASIPDIKPDDSVKGDILELQSRLDTLVLPSNEDIDERIDSVTMPLTLALADLQAELVAIKKQDCERVSN